MSKEIQFTAKLKGRGDMPGVISLLEDGKLLYEDVTNLSKASVREPVVALFKDKYLVDDAEQQVLAIMQKVRKELETSGGSSQVEAEGPAPTAKFPGLIDLVDDGPGPTFLVLEEGNPVTRDRVVINEATYVPPPMDAIQWLLPRSDNVLASYGADNDHDIYLELKSYFKKVSQLPSESHYALLSLWTMHTYLLEHFGYSPYLLLWAVPERGKSRTARAATYAAYRGLVTETLQEANLFRWSNDLGATLAFDVRDLWRKSEKRGSDDILLQRFEKGAMVARVLWPERGKFKDTAYFDVFGASIIAANEMPGEPFNSRCVVVTMPEATVRFANNVEPSQGLPLRERLVAFRARWLNKVLPDAPKPARGRLGDILQPFAQVAALLGPDVQNEFTALAKMLYSERMEDRSTSREARLVIAIEKVWEVQEDGKIGVESIASQYNLGISEKQQLSPESIGRKLSALGFEKGRLKDRNRAYIADDKLLEVLKIKYGLVQAEEYEHYEDLGRSGELSEPSEPSNDAQSPHGQFSDSSQEPPENRPSVSQAQNGQLDSSDNLVGPLGNDSFSEDDEDVLLI
jgi:hypothetical protein